MAREEDVRGLLEHAMGDLAKALALLPELPPNEPVITTPEALEAALAGTAPVLKLSTQLRYPKPLTIRRPVALVSETFEARQDVRIARDEPAPSFGQGFTIAAEHVGCYGLEASHTGAVDIVRVNNDYAHLDRCRILGDPVAGTKRGIGLWAGQWAIARCLIDEIKRIGQDTQAIYAQDMSPGGLIDDCDLYAAGQSVMFGGGDPTDESRTPRNIRLTNSILRKQAAWYTGPWQIKCALELKNCIGFEARDCSFEGAGTSQGQGAYAIVLTPRNQNGKAPYTTVQNVVLERIKVREASGVISMLGRDTNYESGPLADVTVRQLHATEIDPLGPTKLRAEMGSGRLFYFGHGPQRVTLEGITVEGQNTRSLVYMEYEPPTGLVLRNLNLPTSKYGFKTPAGTTVGKMLEYAPDTIVEQVPGPGSTEV